MPTADINGTSIFYQTAGSGYPCLVMHGGLGLDHTYFRPWLDSLGDLFHFVYYDHRGNGRSANTNEQPLTFDQLSADADALRAWLAFDRTAVLGHSIGSFVALEYALRYPQRVSHLILVGSAPSFDYIEEVLQSAQARNSDPQVYAALTAPAGERDEDFERSWLTMMPLYFHSPEKSGQAFAETIYRASAAAVNMELYAVYNVLDRLPEIRVPVCLVSGDDDFITPVSQAERLLDGIPNAVLAVIPDSGHFPFIERPQAFEKAVRTWYENQA